MGSAPDGRIAGLTPDQVGDVFPFHVVFDCDGIVRQAGTALQRICPRIRPGTAIADALSIVRPRGLAFDLEVLRAQQASLFILGGPNRLTLRGQVLVDSSRGLGFLFVAPWITRLDDVEALGLSLADFATHDAMGEFLLLFQTKDLALREAEALADALAEERKALQSANLRLERQMSERERAERALGESELLYRSMVDAVGDVIFQVDASAGTWTLLNPAWTHITGFTAAESLGRKALDFVAPEQAVDVGRWMSDVAAGRTTEHRRVISFITRAGAVREFDTQIHLCRRADGVLQAMAGAAADITAHVERERALTRANDELSRAMRLKDDFLAGMSHELRTPLNGVLGLAGALLEGLYGQLTAEQTEATELVEHNARDLLGLINDILDLAKIGAGRLTLQFAPTSVGGVCAAAVRAVAGAAADKHVELVAEIAPDIPEVFTAEQRVQQILRHLLGNAVKFTSAGGRVTLHATSDQGARMFSIAVRDTGQGIAPDDVARLFQPFSQLEAGLSRRFGGVGLGLVIARRLAELQGGTVTVESAEGTGSCFTLTLPWEPPADLAREAEDWVAPVVASNGSLSTP